MLRRHHYPHNVWTYWCFPFTWFAQLTYTCLLCCKICEAFHINLQSRYSMHIACQTRFVYEKWLPNYSTITVCWGDFNSKQLSFLKFLQNPFLGCQWSVLEGKRNFCTVGSLHKIFKNWFFLSNFPIDWQFLPSNFAQIIR